MRQTLAIILFLVLAVDITYGIVTYQSPFGCSSNSQTTLSPNQNPFSSGANWQVLTSPCFYVIYYGIVGGSAELMSLFAPAKKTAISRK